MKALILVACLSVSGIGCAQDRQPNPWREDLDYLVQRIELMHPDPYAFFPRAEFYRLKDKLSNEIPGLSDVDAVLSISELLATLQDGHTRWAFEYSDPQWLAQNIHLLPILQYPFKDGIHVIAGLPPYGEFVGMKVIRIGSLPIEEAASRLGGMWSHDNSYGERKFLYYTLGIVEMLKRAGAIDDTNKIEVVLQNAQGREVVARLTPVPFMSMAPFIADTWYPQSMEGLVAMNGKTEKAVPLWLKNQDKNLWYEYVPEDKIMFLQINSLNFPKAGLDEEGPFDKLCGQFFQAFDQSKAERLVIDLRRNTGGNHVELPLLKGLLARPHIDMPDRLFLITGRVTFSAAVHLATLLKRYSNITLVGESASGRPNHFGANRGFRLPNHPQFEIRCSIDYYQDAGPLDFNVIGAPDIWAEMTAADYRNNTDPAMEAVKRYDKIIRLAEASARNLEDAYAEKGIPGMKDAYHSIRKPLFESGYNLERFLAEFYDRFLYKNKKGAGDLSEYLAFAVGECSESIDLIYTLAVQLESEGRLDEAGRMYKRCLQLNPAHHYAKMRLGLLEMKP